MAASEPTSLDRMGLNEAMLYLADPSNKAFGVLVNVNTTIGARKTRKILRILLRHNIVGTAICELYRECGGTPIGFVNRVEALE
jgi:hypothetical protein